MIEIYDFENPWKPFLHELQGFASSSHYTIDAWDRAAKYKPRSRTRRERERPRLNPENAPFRPNSIQTPTPHRRQNQSSGKFTSFKKSMIKVFYRKWCRRSSTATSKFAQPNSSYAKSTFNNFIIWWRCDWSKCGDPTTAKSPANSRLSQPTQSPIDAKPTINISPKFFNFIIWNI